MKTISVITPCYNEEENVEPLCEAVKQIFSGYGNYAYEHVFIDNSSTDGTIPKLRKIAALDKNVKVILNAKNFGWIRSPYYGLIQCHGDAVITMSADFQDPPELIHTFIKKWEEGSRIVIGVKNRSEERPLMFLVRKLYYYLIRKISEIDHIDNFFGFGLYDKGFVDFLRKIEDPLPYIRGLVAEFGHDITKIEYTQPKREHGFSKGTFYKLYDAAMLGLVNYSKVPLRLAIFLGFGVGLASALLGVIYFFLKLFYWFDFPTGYAPVIMSMYFLGSVQLIFVGVIGEYIAAIYVLVRKRPLVVEKERINFETAGAPS